MHDDQDQDAPNPDELEPDELEPDELEPAELDDAEILLVRMRLRAEIVNTTKDNVSPELTARYHALNDEITRRAREQWS
jgi:hypothetical protein